MLSWRFSKTSDGSYSECQVSCTDPTTGQDNNVTVKNPLAHPSAPQLILHNIPHGDGSDTQANAVITPATNQWSQTVQSQSTVIPTQNNAVSPSKVQNTTLINHGRELAMSALKRKARKQTEFECTLPFNTSFSAGTVWTLSGFSIDSDPLNWMLREVELNVNDRGSETRLTFTVAQNWDDAGNTNIVRVSNASPAQVAAAKAAGDRATGG